MSAGRSRNHWKTSCFRLLAPAVYVGSLALPALHGLLEHHEKPCVECRERRYSGPIFTSNCGDDCRDPSHHHHDGHDCDHCVLCHWSRLVEAPISGSISAMRLHDVVGDVTHAENDGPSTVSLSSHPIRGPPARDPIA